jgi:hypothetical protein
MGRASSKKNADWLQETRGRFKPGRPDATFPPKRIYRTFNEAWQAQALLDGHVFLSTLERCRGYERTGQGDPREAKHLYRLDLSDKSHSLDAIHIAAARAGIGLGPKMSGQKIRLDVSSTRFLTDAFVICFTAFRPSTEMMETFGRHCVKIVDSVAFFELVHLKLAEQFAITGSGIAPVHYREPSYLNDEPDDVPLGFVKAPDGYRGQREVRMLWSVESNQYPNDGLVLQVPGVKEFVRRAS